MELIKPGTNINFVGRMKLAFIISLALIVISTLSLIIHKGPNLGIDFAGGTLVQIKFKEATSVNDIGAR